MIYIDENRKGNRMELIKETIALIALCAAIWGVMALTYGFAL